VYVDAGQAEAAVVVEVAVLARMTRASRHSQWSKATYRGSSVQWRRPAQQEPTAQATYREATPACLDQETPREMAVG
jgi:hypothetical protein